MNFIPSLIGGTRLGEFNISWPFAILRAEAGQLEIRIRGWDWFLRLPIHSLARQATPSLYTFPVAQVISVKRYLLLPFLASGVRIHHTVPGYPEKIIFWYLGFPGTVVKFISDTGFPLEKIDRRRS